MSTGSRTTRSETRSSTAFNGVRRLRPYTPHRTLSPRRRDTSPATNLSTRGSVGAGSLIGPLPSLRQQPVDIPGAWLDHPHTVHLDLANSVPGDQAPNRVKYGGEGLYGRGRQQKPTRGRSVDSAPITHERLLAGDRRQLCPELLDLP